MGEKSEILELQQIYFDVQDLNGYNRGSLKSILTILRRYYELIDKLYAHYPAVFDNLLHLGVSEVVDHLGVLTKARGIKAKRACYEDLKFYLQQSVLDARTNLRGI